MCTLTYLLNETGYDLFFNRDEQRTRQSAILPLFNQKYRAIFPIDPQGEGTWIAVNERGMSLALLNNYQANIKQRKNVSIEPQSRGLLILSLLMSKKNVIEQLTVMDLAKYQPFSLCIFPDTLSSKNTGVYCCEWSGEQLNITKPDLPKTSSSVDLIKVIHQRTKQFNHFIDQNNPLISQYYDFHFCTETNTSHSVNMSREDAKTVSFSHITVNKNISFKYIDNSTKDENIISIIKRG